MVGVIKKIITAATGVKSESKLPPLIEFHGPENLKVVCVCVLYNVYETLKISHYYYSYC